MTVYKSLTAYWRQRITTESYSPTALVKVLFSQVAAAISGAFIARLLMTLVQILIVRRLGTLLYGEYATVTTSLGLLASLLGMGLDTWILQEGGRDPASLAQNVWQVLFVKTFGAAVLLALLTIAWSSDIVLSSAFVVGVAAIIFDSFAQTGYSALRATQQNVRVAIFQTLTPLSVLILLATTANTQQSVFALLSIQAACNIFITLILLAKIWQLYPPDLEHFVKLRHLVKGAWLFVAADVLGNLYSQAGIAILGATVEPATVGIYRTALHTISFMFLIPSLLFYVGLPLLNAPGLSRQGFRGLVRAMAGSVLCYGVGVWVGLWLMGDMLVTVLFGQEYGAALPFVSIMSVVPLIKSGSFVCVAVLLSCNKAHWRVMLQAVAVAVSVVGGFLVIPVYGSNGAAFLYVAVEAMLFILYCTGALVAVRGLRQ
ncbi:MAG: oligosaccharide flippase family protein [Chloroflexota bacterium]|nr:oligosaccharide flippase family protein [Chloroflexota bacterium]